MWTSSCLHFMCSETTIVRGEFHERLYKILFFRRAVTNQGTEKNHISHKLKVHHTPLKCRFSYNYWLFPEKKILTLFSIKIYAKTISRFSSSLAHEWTITVFSWNQIVSSNRSKKYFFPPKKMSTKIFNFSFRTWNSFQLNFFNKKTTKIPKMLTRSFFLDKKILMDTNIFQPPTRNNPLRIFWKLFLPAPHESRIMYT